LRLRARRKRMLSVQWPMIEGIFRSGAVSPFRAGYAGEATNFRLNVEFSYRVGNSVHPGEYVHKFRTEEDAIA
jgi:hypothetical protein